MKKPQILTDRERRLIAIYSQCQLGMTPKRFYAKWGVTYEEIAFICSRSDSTVRGWFKRGKNRRVPAAADLRHLALMDFLLEHFEEIPGELWKLLCLRSE
ncbi:MULTISPECIES: helix-turn-helix domain-containing protein [unclassified Microcoleus]|uniref:helix-turn-helix domain-containing protein n=1 Tax=unclassified Microcoleus TaxID=2642155 RepID=UPI001DF74EFE|nr:MULTISPECIES: helix-turn-helix domain-containing protein [unclassified Microcoleus]MCC3415886.1 helix-turn-helix domain-containing protein [Microcoleus sp. PH2017_02_FOX_O_A]MCC3520002.1 helix-turn-helix domain-containing protein [Microcoleus sp. PH2017_18_LLB_O_A]MCC3613965.1 helix-turn-helix domain-containing protein [Microcoleus sp. PH2017_40_RAT_O_B]TAE08823.1 MAG: helix-turn-helix domain-containing protein [Oscillatoriales cyanobacterium]